MHTACINAARQMYNSQSSETQGRQTWVIAAVKAMYVSDVAATMAPTLGRNMRDSTDTTATISSDVGTSRNTMARHIAEMHLVPAEMARQGSALSCLPKTVQQGDLQKAA